MKILPKLSLSRKKINYYSDLAKLYTVDRLKRIQKELSYLYLICYVHQRCEKIINNLIQGFMYYIDKYNLDSKKYAGQNIIKTENSFHENKKSIGKLIEIYTDDEIMNNHGDFIREKAYEFMSRDKMKTVSKALLEDDADNTETATMSESEQTKTGQTRAPGRANKTAAKKH